MTEPSTESAERERLHAALEIVGDRWSLAIVEAVLSGRTRFGTLQDAVPGLAPNILSARLRHLAEAGVLVARPYQRRPARFDYEVTARGARLVRAIEALRDWDADPSGDDVCPTCGRPMPADTTWV